MTLSMPADDQRREQVLDGFDRGAGLAEHGGVLDCDAECATVAGISTPRSVRRNGCRVGGGRLR